jgi:hypothetical protein
VNQTLRIGDAEREEAARELGEHYALGRISADEHSERLERRPSSRRSSATCHARSRSGRRRRRATGSGRSRRR